MADPLFAELMKRAVAEHAQLVDPPARQSSPQTSASQPMRPESMALVGGLADAASTYAMLQSGTGREGNPLYAGLHDNPIATGAGVVGSVLVNKLIRALVRKKFPGLADAMAANQGREQLGLAAANTAHSLNGPPYMSSQDDYLNAMSRFQINRDKSK